MPSLSTSSCHEEIEPSLSLEFIENVTDKGASPDVIADKEQFGGLFLIAIVTVFICDQLLWAPCSSCAFTFTLYVPASFHSCFFTTTCPESTKFVHAPVPSPQSK